MISGTNGDKHTGESMCSMCMLKFLGGFLSKSHFCHGNVPRNPSGPSLCVHAAVPTQPPCPWFRVYITHFRILEHPLLPCLGWGELHGGLKKKKQFTIPMAIVSFGQCIAQSLVQMRSHLRRFSSDVLSTMMKNLEWKTLSHNVIAPVLRAAVVAVHFAKQSVAVDHPMKPGCVLVSKCYAEPKRLKPTQNAKNALPATTNAFGQPSHTLI